jgi:hypothetical protein
MKALSELRRRWQSDREAGRTVTLHDREAALLALEKLDAQFEQQHGSGADAGAGEQQKGEGAGAGADAGAGAPTRSSSTDK